MAEKQEKRYVEQFQRDAVTHWIKSGKSAAQVASDLGISGYSLARWREKYVAEEGGPQPEALKN